MNNWDSTSLDDHSNPVRSEQEKRNSLVGISADDPVGSTDDAVGSTDGDVDNNPSIAASTARSRFLSVTCMLGAGVCLVLGTLGFLLPVIPGTPFVLLASVLLLKGSPRLHQKLLKSRFFGRILRDWEERGGIRHQDKIRAIVIVVAGAVFSFLFGPQQPLLRLIGSFFIIIGLLVILRLPPARD